MLVGKQLTLQQLDLIDSLVVGDSVAVENLRHKLETIYVITDNVLLERIKKRLQREVLINKNFIKLYNGKDDYVLNTTILADRQLTEQII